MIAKTPPMSTNEHPSRVHERQGGGREGQERVDEHQGFVHDRRGRVRARHGRVHERQGRVDIAELSEETANFDIPPLSVFLPSVSQLCTLLDLCDIMLARIYAKFAKLMLP